MLSLIPSLLTYQQFSPFIIRLALAAALLYMAYRALKTAPSSMHKIGAIIEAIAGILILIGLWTQGAAIAVIITLVLRILGKIKSRAFLTDGVNYYLLLLVLAASLLFTGAGAVAFDLPL